MDHLASLSSCGMLAADRVSGTACRDLHPSLLSLLGSWQGEITLASQGGYECLSSTTCQIELDAPGYAGIGHRHLSVRCTTLEQGCEQCASADAGWRLELFAAKYHVQKGCWPLQPGTAGRWCIM